MTQLFKRILFGRSAVAVALTLSGLVTISGARASGVDGGQSRIWPLDTQINLTSSFGEYRSGHLHAGLDIKTYGKEGVPCLAVGDGYVSRMRAAPNGYGKAVYLKLDSGETAVYAHLAEFAPQLEAALYGQQLEAGRYRIDSYYEPDQFRVTEGEIIGYSGRTGASAPHLHFEVRDENENPLNPLSRGWKLADRSPPTIRGVVFVPIAEHSLVSGDFKPQNIPLREVGGDRYVASDTLVIRGRVGVGAYIIDRLNSKSGRLAPYRVELTVDGVMLSSITFESFTYAHTAEVDLAYDIERVRKDRENYLLLFRRTGETLWNRSFVHDGVIDADVLPSMVGEKKSVYTAVIRTVDRAGNVATALLPFMIDDSSREPASTHTASYASDEELPGLRFFEGLLGIKPTWADAFGVSTDLEPKSQVGGDARYVLTVEELLGNGHTSGHPIDFAGSGGVKTYVIPARGGQRTASRIDRLGVEVITRDNSFYSDVFLYVAEGKDIENDVSPADGLVQAARPFRVGPLSLAFRKPIELRREGMNEEGRAAFYRLDEKKKEWRFEGGDFAGDTLVASVRAPGVFGIFVDERPPRIESGAFRTYSSYGTGVAVREIVIKIEDEGSGVDDERTEVYVEGHKQIARWDGFSDRMYVRLRDDAVQGVIDVSIVAFDRVGNKSRKDSQVDTSAAQN